MWSRSFYSCLLRRLCVFIVCCTMLPCNQKYQSTNVNKPYFFGLCTRTHDPVSMEPIFTIPVARLCFLLFFSFCCCCCWAGGLFSVQWSTLPLLHPRGTIRHWLLGVNTYRSPLPFQQNWRAARRSGTTQMLCDYLAAALVTNSGVMCDSGSSRCFPNY